MGRLIIGLIIGILLGGALTFYFFVGVPRAAVAPGVPIQAPDASGLPSGAAQIVLRQQFLNEALGTIFQEMTAPAFPLSDPSADCEGRITVQREGSGVQTGVTSAEITGLTPSRFTVSTFICPNTI